MRKLRELRLAIVAAIPELEANPDKLLTFVEQGSGNDKARSPSLSFRYDYTAVLVLTDFAGDVDAVMIAVSAFLKENQPDRADDQFVQFNAEILDNDAVDLELKVALTESVIVTDHSDGTRNVTHIGEPRLSEGNVLGNPDTSEWQQRDAY